MSEPFWLLDLGPCCDGNRELHGCGRTFSSGARIFFEVRDDRYRQANRRGRFGRHTNAEFDRQLGRNSCLSPGGILTDHAGDQRADTSGQLWPARFRPPLPKQLESHAVPSDQSVGPDNEQGIPPTEQSGPEYETESRGIIQATRLDLVFRIEGQLLSEE